MSERDARRWTRLRPDSLTEAKVKLLHGAKARAVRLVDLSPGGMAIQMLPMPSAPLGVGDRIRLQIRFRGQRSVEIPARVVHVRRMIAGAWRISLGWIQDPQAWDKVDRREFPRLELSVQDGFAARISIAHVHGLWTRVAILDISSDRGMRVEGQGGPIWLLPGMEVDVMLDLPILHEMPLRSQVLWVRPIEGGLVQAGLRVLDLEAPALQALDEWLAMAQLWSPRELVSRGFPSPSIPGQYRFRSAEAKVEHDVLRAYLEACARRDTRIGFEALPPLPPRPTGQTIVGCWDGPRLVAAIAIDLEPELSGGRSDELLLSAAGFEIDWFDREIVRGLWSQALRIFLASGRERFRIWCPIGRERIYRMLGMDPVQNLSIALPPSPGDWMELARETILTGKGMNPVAWVWAYGEVGRFHSQQGNVHLDGKQRILKALRIALKLIFSDLQLPRIRRRLALEMESWRSQATEDRV